nr:PREDICTED: toll/interleukin-1 receptor domain-containing adapter protein isoform X1 [Lepisosteus oculatus]
MSFSLWRILPRRKRGSAPGSSADEREPPAASRSSSSSLASPSSSWSPMPDLRSSARWSRDYDVCVCHSEADISEAQLLVSHLEARQPPLRCFLHWRDSAPGGAVPTELFRAVSSSHCWAVLITRSFLGDPWCRYQVHQALAEAPMADGRLIPIMLQLPRAEYPDELRFYYYIDVTLDRERGYGLVYKSVLSYLLKVCKTDGNSQSSGRHSCPDSQRSLAVDGLSDLAPRRVQPCSGTATPSPSEPELLHNPGSPQPGGDAAGAGDSQANASKRESPRPPICPTLLARDAVG